MYTHETTVRLRDTDAAGVIFFSRQFTMAHDAFEHYLDSAEMGLGQLFRHADYRIPIVHASADYSAPIRVGDRLRIEIRSERIGSTSFTLTYRLVNQHEIEVGRVRTVQVAVDRDAWKKRPIPAELRAALEKLK